MLKQLLAGLLLLLHHAYLSNSQTCTDGNLRLSGSGERDYGRIEICLSESWGTICDDFWENQDASVACRQLGFSEYGAIAAKDSYTESSLQMHIIDLNCTGTEQSLMDCPRNSLVGIHTCGSREDASLRCQALSVTHSNCTDGDLRLLGGSVSYEGRVEVCINRAWGTVCYASRRYYGSYWGTNEATVVCRQLGHQEKGATAYRTVSSTFGGGSGPVFLTNLGCQGSESSLLNCSRSVFIGSYCTHGRDVGVKCEPLCHSRTIRLVNTDNTVNSSYGRVEVCVNGTWGTVCDNFWGNEDASVACRQLGYSEYGAIATRGSYTEYTWPFHIIDINCTGNERTIWDCPYNKLFHVHTCTQAQDASLRCQVQGTISHNCTDGDIRLVGGSTKYEGRVEICINSVWGTICYGRYRGYWDHSDGMVVCRQLGYQELGFVLYPISSSKFGTGSGPVLFSNIGCRGSEESLLECPKQIFVGTYCTHYRDVGIQCHSFCESDTIRLANMESTNSTYGRVEICVNGTWGTICDDFWGNADASVVCRQLGFSENGAIAGQGTLTESSWPFHIIDLNCTGSELTLFDCPHNGLVGLHNCIRTHDASLRCQEGITFFSNCSDGEVRLVGGVNEYEGRVEICINGAWGTVCHSYWDVRDARVICRQLGHQELGVTVTTTTTSSVYGLGSGPIFLSDVRCSGTETTLLDCRYAAISLRTFCTHNRDLGVKCEALCESGTIRLVSEGNSYFRRYGRVEICINQAWSTICDQHWDNIDASVVCRQLGFSPYGALALQNLFTEYVWPLTITNINCSGSEGRLLDCTYSTEPISTCYQRSDASVMCQDTQTMYSDCSDGELRLAGKVTATSGRLEVCYNRAWGTVCSYAWGTTESRLACQLLGFQAYGSFSISSSSVLYAGYGDGPIFSYRTNCRGSEGSLNECSLQHYYSSSYCNHFHDVTLNCTAPCSHGEVQLVAANRRRAGSVHVCVNGTWGGVCGGESNHNFATVICQQLGFSPYGAFAGRNLWSDNTFHYYVMYHPQCTGNESNILSCPYNNSNSISSQCKHTSVICFPNGIVATDCEEGNIRLSGDLPNQGRVEICRGNVWGSVCNSYSYYDDDNDVICRMLGYNWGSSNYRTPSGLQNPLMFVNFGCDSNYHNTLSDCNRPSGVTTALVSTSCTPSNALGVLCTFPCLDGDVRVADGDGLSYGRFEICISGVWGFVCGDMFWDNTAAGVACKELGYSQYGSISISTRYYYNHRITSVIHSVQCNGSEETLLDCQHNNGSSAQCEGILASVICRGSNIQSKNCSDGEIRLIGGPSSNKGQLEVCLDSTWATVCDTSFSTREGAVACRQLGYQSYGAKVRYNSFYGQGKGPIYGYSCNGREKSLFSCSRLSYYSISRCIHYKDVAVECEVPCMNGSIRLEGDSSQNSGRVEVCINNTWTLICPDDWDNNDSAVICHQLGYLRAGSNITRALYNSYYFLEEPFHITHLNCSGTENTIWNCSYSVQRTCERRNYGAALSCVVEISSCADLQEGSIRVVDGPSSREGRVEICSGGRWGTICDRYQYWDYEDARVVCHQLGFAAAGAIATRNHYGTGAIHYSNFHCSGNEQNLTSCSHSLANSYCSHSSDVGVICRAPCKDRDVQLVGDRRYTNFGRVEVCINGNWNRLCGINATHKLASVICQQLGLSPQGAILRRTTFPLTSSYSYYFLATPNCTGNEESLFNCSYAIVPSGFTCEYEAGVICQDPSPIPSNCTDYDIRLREKDSMYKGIVQICLNGIWGTICSGGLNNGARQLMCAKLGLQRATNGAFQASANPDDIFIVQSLSCYDSYSNISQCSFSFYTKSSGYCDGRYAAGLHCEEPCINGTIRLRGSTYATYGRVELCVSGTWGTVCNTFWDDQDASVVCGQLGFAPHGAVATHHLLPEYGLPVAIYDLNCTGSENRITECPHNALNVRNCYHQRDASVICQRRDVHYANCTTGELRVESSALQGSENATRGRLEVCSNKVWFSIGYTYAWYRSNSVTTSVACRLLGYDDAEVFNSYFLEHLQVPVYPLDFHSCSSRSTNETLLSCVYPYSVYLTPSSEVGISCKPRTIVCHHGEIRTSYLQYGRVDVCMEGRWGTVCNEFWDNKDASVVCRQLGYSPNGAIALTGRHYSEVNLPHLIINISCNGSEAHFLNCSYNTIGNCYHRDDAAVVCQVNPITTDCVDGDIRLVGGSTALEGRVEVCFNNVWGAICDSYFSSEEASVTCTQLGFQRADSRSHGDSYFGASNATFYMTYLRCSGSEKRLIDCDYNSNALTSCGSGSHAGVTCVESCPEGEVRLRGGSQASGGRVEVCIEQSWTTICDVYWDNQDASVLCRQLGFSSYGAIAAKGGYTEGLLLFGITDIHCNGTEENITLCSQNEIQLHNCQTHDDAGVVCQDVSTHESLCTDGNVRLVGGNTNSEGRVEICINSAWGTICDSSWGTEEANIVCHQLGFLSQGSVARRYAYYGMGSGPILLSSLYCTGTESSLLECNRNMYRTLTCTHRSDAGVTCEVPCTNENVRVVTSYNGAGRIEVCINSSWGTICSITWDDIDASVACRQSGYSPYGAFALSHEYQTNIWPPVIRDLTCMGNESSLFNCTYSLVDNSRACAYYASIICQDPLTHFSNCTNGEVRLVNGATRNEGRVELCYNNVWGTICDYHWDVADANVICRQLGYHSVGAVRYRYAHFGRGTGPIFIFRIGCSGSESSLLQCPWTHFQSGCSHYNDAGVRCEEICSDGTIRIAGGSTSLAGVVEVCVNTRWGTICENDWNNTTALVVCRQLGHQNGIIADQSQFSAITRLVQLSEVSCSGNETSIYECSYSTSSSATCSGVAAIVCQDVENNTTRNNTGPDISPPILTFSSPIDNPWFNNGSLELSWTYNEEAFSRCQLLTSVYLLIVNCSSNRVSFSNLQPGSYTLYIQAEDKAGNGAQEVIVTWTVDQASPTLRITSTLPPMFSKEQQWTFTFECQDTSPCTTYCSVHVIGSTTSFETCARRWIASGFANEDSLEFILQGLDAVGNMAPMISHQWTVDTVAPNISLPSNVTLSCNEDFGPARTGTPVVVDNLDASPILLFTDHPVQSCGVVRVWNATDAAGNSAIVSQGLSVINPLPPIVQDPIIISIPCGSIESIISNPQYTNLTVIHPCGRPTTATFIDSAPIDKCGFSFNRSWTIQDDCGSNISFHQIVHILDQQLPDNPADRQVNVAINEALMWRQYPGAVRYRVYIWPTGNDRPRQPTSEVTALEYYPQQSFYPGTQYKWQIYYIIEADKIIQSPIWSFETRPYPDLAVTSITLPAMAFSGQRFEVSWTVENIGNLSSITSYWHDAVFIGPSTEFRRSRRAIVVVHRSFIDPQDGYTTSGTVNLQPTDLGTFYIFVETDIYRRVNEATVLSV